VAVIAMAIALLVTENRLVVQDVGFGLLTLTTPARRVSIAERGQSAAVRIPVHEAGVRQLLHPFNQQLERGKSRYG
jgi:hypothetical protein